MERKSKKNSVKKDAKKNAKKDNKDITKNAKDSKTPSEVELCAFCLYPKRDPVPLLCKHSYCRSCLNLYYQARSWQAERCPICRCSLKPPRESIFQRSNWRMLTVLMLGCIALSYGPFHLLLNYW